MFEGWKNVEVLCCRNCGKSKTRAKRIKLVVVESTGKGSHAFVCPQCNQVMVWDTEPSHAELLVSYGVKKIVWPANPGGAALRATDVQSFTSQLNAEGEWEQWLGILNHVHAK